MQKDIGATKNHAIKEQIQRKGTKKKKKSPLVVGQMIIYVNGNQNGNPKRSVTDFGSISVFLSLVCMKEEPVPLQKIQVNIFFNKYLFGMIRKILSFFSVKSSCKSLICKRWKPTKSSYKWKSCCLWWKLKKKDQDYLQIYRTDQYFLSGRFQDVYGW